MPRRERSGTRVASAKKLSTDAKIVTKMREAAAYFTNLGRVSLVLTEVLFHRRTPILLMNDSFSNNSMRKASTLHFGTGHTQQEQCSAFFFFPPQSFS